MPGAHAKRGGEVGIEGLYFEGTRLSVGPLGLRREPPAHRLAVMPAE